MTHARTAADARRSSGVSPLFLFACGVVLAAAGTLFYWLEQEPKAHVPTAADEVAAAEAAAARRMQKMRKREAQARAEMERKEAEQRAQRALLADGPTEAAAKKEREEFARRQAAAIDAQRTAAETEAAWQRFYKPSPECRDAASATRVECVNEYVKAKRDFQAGLVARSN
jgi:hypothetical protein